MENEGLYTKIVYRSNYLYNEGLKKAKVRDLSGAVICLRESLVYFEMGEVVQALAQWIISRNNDTSKDNPALYYMDKIKSNQGKLEAIDQTLHKYNQALQYTYQGSYDLAIIQLKKVLSINERLIPAYQLLALIYFQTEEYEKSRRTIIRGLRIDRNNTKL